MSIERTAKCQLVKCPRVIVPDWVYSGNSTFLNIITPAIKEYLRKIKNVVYVDRNIIVSDKHLYIFIEIDNVEKVIQWVKMIMTK